MNLCVHLMNNLMHEEYNFKGVNFNELEDLEAIATQNRLQHQESELIKQKEREEKAKERKNKQEQDRELKEQKEKELKEQREKEKQEREKEKQEKELKRKRNINEANDKKSNSIKTNPKSKKDMADDDDDDIIMGENKFEPLGTIGGNKKSDSNISKNDNVSEGKLDTDKGKNKKENIKINEEVIVDEVKSRNGKANNISRTSNSNSNEL